ncbi:MAG: hypothetical protein U1F53_04315 [Burkholderiaceae bacterium]
MSIMKDSAPTLSARRPATSSPPAPSGAATSASTSSRMRCTACEAWSRPSTESTPRMAPSSPGTGASSSRSVGARLKRSSCCSTSASEARSSATTLPMVWRSDTSRYSASIQGSTGACSPPAVTVARRCARRCTRCCISARSRSMSSSDASTHSRAVATSIASAGEGAVPRWVAAVSALASTSPWG